MKVSGTDPNIPLVPQTGKNADQLRENLKRIKMPPGFKIDLYAVVPDARSIAGAPSTNMMFVGTRKTNVWAVTNRNSGLLKDAVLRAIQASALIGVRALLCHAIDEEAMGFYRKHGFESSPLDPLTLMLGLQTG